MPIDHALNKILNHLNEKKQADFSGYRASMLQDRIHQRCAANHCKDTADYLSYLKKNPQELNILFDALTINVSRFFRNPLTFEYIAKCIFPALVHEQSNENALSLRLWSNGCAMGEEPYSMAILINELNENTAKKINPTIFATDIDRTILEKARQGIYSFESIKEIKYGLLKKYFSMQGNEFRLNSKIKDSVAFSVYDILDRHTYAPPESVFGEFDMVLCRNVMIYFNEAAQKKICDKMHKALTMNGYLVLGEAEMLSEKHQKYFKKVNKCCHIYQKMQ